MPKRYYQHILYLCILNISPFVTASRINNYDQIEPSDHRELFIDNNIQTFLENVFTEVTDRTTRKFQTLQLTNIM